MIDFYYHKQGVLKNKLGITDYVRFKEVEHYYYNSHLKELIRTTNFSYNPDYMCKLHYILFNDFYDWAGKYRLINLDYKEPTLGGYIMQFGSFEDIDNKVTKVFHEIKRVKLSDLSMDEKLEYITIVATKLWGIHPFRDCNTRTLIAFINQYCSFSSLSFEIDILNNNLGYFRRSLVAATYDDLGVVPNKSYILRIMKDALRENYQKKWTKC